ncbi:acyl-CoA dehydrogenase family member 11 isoform X3 [Hydra vulgaris]|uniref:Acyl-CoA dehydrogenase family member 11 isoform X3 n=1 Tax=Hydra vulgaris TaxID=6087 RepID=A0ABM4CP94_HYDVU
MHSVKRKLLNVCNKLHLKRTLKYHGDFTSSKTGRFVQEKPFLGNQYLDDPLLQNYLAKYLPPEVFNLVDKDLKLLGAAVAGYILHHHENVCSFEPQLIQYDAWGKRIDKLVMHPSWNALHDICAEEGLVSIPYVSKLDKWGRLYQAAKLYLFSPSSGLYSCPIAMTDGAASILKARPEQPFKDAYEKLISNNPNLFWTSGQWMTEKKGGSDVVNSTETIAVPQSDGTFKLHGFKWFTSATDANISLTLAKIVEDGIYQPNLTLFYLETKTAAGELNGISIEKLKKKLGTRQMPTAELILSGSKAYKLSDGRGIASIAPMLTITRLHNSVSSVSIMRRLLNLANDYSKKRESFGKKLIEHPLHALTLEKMEVEQQAAFFFLMRVFTLFGLIESGAANNEEKLLLRILVPLLKLYTGKQVVSVISEALECFGGHGYLEDTGLPVYLRDAQVLSIWEGTTNVLSLDVLRSIHKTKGEVLKTFIYDVQRNLTPSSNKSDVLQNAKSILVNSFDNLKGYINSVQFKQELFSEVTARDLSYSLARVYMGSLLYNEAATMHVDSKSSVNLIKIAYRWIAGQDLIPVVTADKLNY